jgi:hypothetical protein
MERDDATTGSDTPVVIGEQLSIETDAKTGTWNEEQTVNYQWVDTPSSGTWNYIFYVKSNDSNGTVYNSNITILKF